MIFSRDYIGYLARRTVKHLIDAKMITTSDLKVTEERVNAALLSRGQDQIAGGGEFLPGAEQSSQ